MKYARTVTILFVLLGSLVGNAAELAGVIAPESVSVAGKELMLNGMGLRTKTIFNVNVYVGALYLPRRSQSTAEIMAMTGPKRLDLIFLRDVGAYDVRNSWDEGFELNCDRRCEAIAAPIEKLKSLSLDIKSGQKVSFDLVDGKTTIRMGDAVPATIEGKDFADLVLENFIGVPLSEEVKDGLLGKFMSPTVSTGAREIAGSRAP